MRALRARRKREIWCSLAMHVRAYARTYTYVRTPSPSPSRCARTHARMRASCTCVCVRSQPGERERYGALSPCTYARARVRTDVYVRTYVRMLFGLKRCPPQPGGRSSLSPLNQIFTYVRTYVSNPPSRTGTGYQFGYGTAHATSAGRFARHLVASTVGLHNDQLPLSHG